MRVIKPPAELLREHGGFASIPNEVIDHPYWVSARADSAFAALVKLYRVGGYKFPNLRQVAEQTGYNYNTWRHHLRTLVEAGFVRKVGLDLELFPFEDGTALPEVEAPEFKPAEETIADSVAAMPKREKGTLSPKERHALIKEAWNKHKPDNFLSADGSLNPSHYLAIETHTKRLGHDRDDYDGFISAVMRGISADETGFWASTTSFFKGVFGEGINPGDKKFQQVERLYKIGMQHAPKIKPQDKGDDWYLEQAQRLWAECSLRPCPYTRVMRVTLETVEQAELVAGGPNLNDGLKRGTHSLEYDDVRRRVDGLKKLQMGPTGFPEWYNEEVLGLTFTAEYDFPLYWTSADKLPRN